MTEIVKSYDLWLVVLSLAIDAVGAFAAFDIGGRVRNVAGRQRSLWAILAGIALGWTALSVFLLGTLALRLPVPIAYDPAALLGALVVGSIIGAAAFAWADNAHDGARGILCGALAGVGVVVTQGIAHSALQMAAVQTGDPAIAVAAITLAIAIAAIAFVVWRANDRQRNRLAAAAILAGGIGKSHYLAFEALRFTTPNDAAGALEPAAVGVHSLTVMIALGCGTALIVALQIAAGIIDRRLSVFRVREAEVLRLSARRFRNLVQSTNDLIFVLDGGGVVNFVHPAGAARLGLSALDLIGRDLLTLLDGSGAEQVRALLADPLPAGRLSEITGLQLPDDAGDLHDFDATLSNLLDEPTIEGFVLTMHDVTERERAATRLREAAALAEQANRAKTQFLANISHELRTPLNAIIGFSDMIANEVLGPIDKPAYRDYAGDIRQSGHRLLAIINDILDITRLEAGQLDLRRSVVHTDRLIDDAVASARGQAEARGVAIAIEVSEPPVMLYGDERRLRQILANLLSNAIKFSSAADSIIVQMHRANDHEVVIAVVDRGVGISLDSLSKIGQPFFQVDATLARSHEGVGLGLSIAKALAELHGGRLEVFSQPGEGTEVRVILPIAPSLAETVA